MLAERHPRLSQFEHFLMITDRLHYFFTLNAGLATAAKSAPCSSLANNYGNYFHFLHIMVFFPDTNR